MKRFDPQVRWGYYANIRQVNLGFNMDRTTYTDNRAHVISLEGASYELDVGGYQLKDDICIDLNN